MKSLLFSAVAMIMIMSTSTEISAQQYKIRQVNSISGMNMESTVYVKGKRKRTESAGMMGMSTPTTIEQCDKQRTIKINDKKKLYFIVPFSTEQDEVIDEDAKPVTAVKKEPQPTTRTTRKGGTITMWYNITDTGERKKMHGLTARHVWTYSKMKPSADACSMKDSMIIKTDGWYIDLPEFNCPISYRPGTATQPTYNQPECTDKFVTRKSGKGKLGFPLTQTTTIIMGGKTTEFSTSLETLEFSTAKLDSMLFEIPPGYTEARSEEELQDKMDVNAMIDQYKNQNNNNNNKNNNNQDQTTRPKPAGIRIGVYEPQGEGQVSPSILQQHMINTLTTGNMDAVAISSPEDAKSKNCTYTLSTDITRVKQASKVGGLIKAIKNTDPNAASSFTIEASQSLLKVSDGSVRLKPRINGKFEGKAEDAAKKGMDEGCRQVIQELN